MSQISEVALSTGRSSEQTVTMGAGEIGQTQKVEYYQNEDQMGVNPLPLIFFVVLFGLAIYKLYKYK